MRSTIVRSGVALAVVTVVAAAGVVVAGVSIPHTTVAAAPPSTSSVGQITAVYPSEVDHCYIDGMIPHHAQALELSAAVLAADGVRERTRALAEFIVVDQSAEIETMRRWQQAWQRALPVADGADSAHAASAHAGSAHAADGAIARGCGEHGEHVGMAGMATPAQLSELAAADGQDADSLFLELMIVHHEGALEMATRAVREGTNAFVRASAKHVLVEQDREIAAMTALLEDLR